MRNYSVPPIPESVWRNPLHFIAFGFGSGAIPVAPGTFGTFLAIPFYLLIRPTPIYVYCGIVLIITLVSIWICDKVSKEIGVDDHQGMNLDEFVGFFVTMIAAPHGCWWILLGVVLFRFFDIVKPFPIRQIDEKVHGGFGMILDDVCAGVYSCIIIQLVAWGLKASF